MITKMIDTLWLQVQKQGLAFSLIALLAYFFWAENNKLKTEIEKLNAKIDICNQAQLQSFANELKQSTLVIEKNNELLGRIDNKIRILP